MKKNTNFPGLEGLKENNTSQIIDQTFQTFIKEEKMSKPSDSAMATSTQEDANDSSVSEEKLKLSLGDESSADSINMTLEDSFDLNLGTGDELDLSDSPPESFSPEEQLGDISLVDGSLNTSSRELSDASEALLDDFGEIDSSENAGFPAAEVSGNDGPGLPYDFSLESTDLGSEPEGLKLSSSEDPESGDLNIPLGDDVPEEEVGFDLSLGDSADEVLTLKDDIPSAEGEFGIQPGDATGPDFDLSFGSEAQLDSDFSEDAKEKLKEIDALMDFDTSQVSISASVPDSSLKDGKLDEPLVSADLDLGSIDFGAEESQSAPSVSRDQRPKKKKRETAPVPGSVPSSKVSQDLKEISGAYSGEMERLQATISNLRSDREELLQKIQKLEDDKLLHSRQTLTMRAELDEKKIELTIIRKKLNEEIHELNDRIKLFDEKKLILEEKNRLLTQELDKASQKNKIDLKKVQMRERELEQRLELLKADAETQIRNRDLKILELKRKIDAMEFDMESISQQEKRSVESRFELEDKLEKAIKTLRTAITVLEDDNEKSAVLSALKKNIEV